MNRFDIVWFLAYHDSKADTGIRRRECDRDDDDNLDGMQLTNLAADAFIALTIFFCVVVGVSDFTVS